MQLNLQSEEQVARAFDSIATTVTRATGPGNFDGVTVQPMIWLSGYELIVGCKIDLQFGPVIAFGTGGQLVEVFSDRALGSATANFDIRPADDGRTKIFTALKGIRGQRWPLI